MNNRLHNSTGTFSVFYEETVTIMFIEKSGAAVKIAHYTIDIKKIILLNYRWNP